ncbi:MAG: phage baseplate protein [Rhabdaerophilum sp.]
MSADFELIAEEFRDLRRINARIERKLASVAMIGKVIERHGDKVRLEFDQKDAATGKPFRSPLARIGASSGSGSNGHKERNRPAIGETMLLISPNGEIGAHSRAYPYGPTDDNPEPSGDDEFDRVFEHGNARIAIMNGKIRVTVGESGFELTEVELKMLGVFRAKDGSRPAHYAGGIDTGGDFAIDGNSKLLI